MSLRLSRRLVLFMVVLGVGGALLRAGVVGAQESTAPVRIGYAIARTGPFAPAAQITQEPNYILWAEEVNAAGGLDVKGTKRKIELIGYDDGGDMSRAVGIYNRLMSTQHVDLVLPPWGTTENFAIALLANRYGYPLLAPTVLSRQLIDMKISYFFAMLQQSDRMMNALVDFLVEKKIKRVGVIYMQDHFGFENSDALSQALRRANIDVVVHRSYPLGVKDLSRPLKLMKERGVDAFVGITYPPETILVSKQAKEIGFSPKIFYAAVGTAFPLYRQVMGASAEEVMGMGSWNPKSNPEAERYFEAHVKRFKKEPDRWASGHTWAGLQILQQAVAKVGLDRKAIRDYIENNTFQTIVGPIRFNGSENVSTPGTIGQWQNGEFEVVWPKSRATAPPVFPKPDWR